MAVKGAYPVRRTVTCQECGYVRKGNDSQAARARLPCVNCNELTTHEPQGDILPYRGHGLDRTMTDRQKQKELGKRIRFVAHQLQRRPTAQEVQDYTDISRESIRRYFESYDHAVYQAFSNIG